MDPTNNGHAAGVTTEQLLAKIGRLTIENDVRQYRIQQLTQANRDLTEELTRLRDGLPVADCNGR